MRYFVAIIGVLVLVTASFAAPVAPKPLAAPEWLPRYDMAIDLDVKGQQARVTQQVAWVNRSEKAVHEIVFNVHSHYTPPKNPVDRLFISKMLEIMRVPAREGLYDKNAFELHKVQLLRQEGQEWKASDANHRFRTDLETALVVTLPEAIQPGKAVALSLTYTLHLPQKQGRWGQWHEVTCLSNWHPVVAFHDAERGWQPTPFVPWHQPFFNEAGVYNVRVRLPKDHQIACTGSVTKTKEDGAFKDVWIGPVTARDFTFIASERFQEFSTMAGDVKVKCLAFKEHEHYANVLMGFAARAIQAYSKWFGKYPYPEFTIAESYFGWNGNECCGLVMIDERVFAMPHFAEGYVEYLISHEVGHQWWYNTVGTDGFRETFMDEALATYFAHRLLNQEEGKNNQLLKFPKGLSWLPGINREDYRYSQFYATLRNGELGPAVQEMTKYRHVGNLFSAAYDRGGKIVGMIEERLGEAAFMDFMRRIYTRYYFRVLRVEDFRKELEEYTGRPWGDFFNNWLLQNGMSDWAVESVDVQKFTDDKQDGVQQAGYTEPRDKFKATVYLKQNSDYDEATTLGFSFDDGTNYTIRVPIVSRAGLQTIESPIARIEPLENHRVKVEVLLPAEPNQIAVDPDQVLPDTQPANNYWKPRVRWRITPFYTFLEETTFTTAYDRWNVIAGPWYYGPSYADAWYTRSSIMGLRTGAFRTEEFSGGVYAGYRPSYRDVAVGVDGLLPHFPFGRTETGFHAEKSIAQFTKNGADLDRASIFTRYIIDESPSMYTAPMHHIETFASWQRNFLPTPRNTAPNAINFNQATNVGVHYHLDLLTPYWDPEVGFKFDATYAYTVPIFGQQTSTHQVQGQLSLVQAPPEGLGWLSRTRLALRGYGAWASEPRARMFTLGGDMLFRGFDMAERQGSLAWIGSVEWRMPLWCRAEIDAVDHFFRLKNVYLAPFYEVGDIYLDQKSLGPVAHAVGMGFRFDVAWFSFLERTMLRLDVAKTVNVNSGYQFWFGIQHPF